MNQEVINKIQYAEIDLDKINSIYKSKHTNKEMQLLYCSLLNNGLIMPITITEYDNKIFIVDGNLRYNFIRQIKKQNIEFNFPINIIQIPYSTVNTYFQTQFNFNYNNQYSKLQLAIFMSYHYWNDIKNESHKRQLLGRKTTKIGKTAQIIGKLIGVNEKYINLAHKLLLLNPDVIYYTFYIQRYNILRTEILDVLSMNNPNVLINKIQILNKYPSSNIEYSIIKHAKFLLEKENNNNNDNTIK